MEEYLAPVVLIVIIAFIAFAVIVGIVCNRCPRCKAKLAESSTGDANYSGTLYCPKCGYVAKESWR